MHWTDETSWAGVDILGTHVHCVNFADTLAQIAAWIQERRALSAAPSGFPCSAARQICTINPEFIMTARRDARFADVLRRADLCVPDGVGVVWAARLLGAPVTERVTGSDGIYRICARAAQEGWRVYLLGAAPGVAERTAHRLQQHYSGLLVAGTHSGSPDDADWPDIQRRVRASRADVLLVAFGHPRQEFWINGHRAELPVAVALGVGGAFDFVAGVTQRAPQWMQRLGLEWLHRLIQQPWRWRRMTALPQFVVLVVHQFVKAQIAKWRDRR